MLTISLRRQKQSKYSIWPVSEARREVTKHSAELIDSRQRKPGILVRSLSIVNDDVRLQQSEKEGKSAI